MEFQILLLVLLQKLKVDFQRAVLRFASSGFVDNKSGNHNNGGLFLVFCYHTVRCDIGAKAWLKWFAVLHEICLHICNLIEYIHTKWIIFFLSLSSFVV